MSAEAGPPVAAVAAAAAAAGMVVGAPAAGTRTACSAGGEAEREGTGATGEPPSAVAAEAAEAAAFESLSAEREEGRVAQSFGAMEYF